MADATVIPVEYDLVVPRRATLLETFELPFAGTGKTVSAQVWTSYEKTQLICDLDVEVVEETPALIINVTVDWQDLQNVSGSGVWDLAVDNGDGTRDHWIKGRAYVDMRVT